MSETNAHDFEFAGLNGGILKLSDFKGKVLLVINTASQCGFTKQYKQMEELHQAYKDQGVVVIGVPSPSFGKQEFAENSETQCFLDEKYPVTFPVTSIYKTRGKEAHPFYAWAKKEAGIGNAPKWNFHKYLIGTKGEFITGFGSRTLPTSDEITAAIKQAKQA
jgi:glutathione peroxidase